ncbi:hypothetical protein H9P43_006038 [Blastocladiella emersonii ATCC 22665]|nr:hypothetical protein H9P43_006038 [Blastocladiella emersonii ATCC 22665]
MHDRLFAYSWFRAPMDNNTLELDVLTRATSAWQTANDVTIDFQLLPVGSTSNDIMGTINAYFSAASPVIDVVCLDIVWPGQLAGHLAPLDTLVTPQAVAQHAPASLEPGVVKGKLLALPAWSDYGLMYYRKDLLARYGFMGPPSTWDEMATILARILPAEQSTTPTLAGFVTQLRSYEGLTCNVMEWLGGAGAGTLLESNATLSSLESSPAYPAVLRIAERTRRWVRDGLIGPTSLTSTETETADAWLAGNAVFLRHWPHIRHATAKANVSWTWDVAPLPSEIKGGAGGAVIGGWAYAVSRYSKQVGVAAKVVEYLAGKDVQKSRILTNNKLPSIPALYDDPEVCAALGMCDTLRRLQLVARPSSPAGANYVYVSEHISTAWASILRGDTTPARALKQMNANMAAVLGIDLLGPPTNVLPGDPIGIAVFALTGVGIAITLGSAVFLTVHRAAKPIRAASVPLLAAALAGMAMCYAWMSLLIGIPTPASCVAQTWLLAFGAALTLATVVVKSYRLYCVACNPYLAKAAPSLRVLGAFVAAFMSVDAILLAIWQGADPLAPTDVKLTSTRYTGCASRDPGFHTAMVAVTGVYHALILALCVWLAVKTRDVGGGYSDSRAVGFAIYNVVLSVVLVLLLVNTVETHRYQVLAQAVGTFSAVTVMQASLVIPKLFEAASSARKGKQRKSEVRDIVVSTVAAPQTFNPGEITTVQHAPKQKQLMRNTSAEAASSSSNLAQQQQQQIGKSGELSYRVGRSAFAVHFAAWQLAKAHLITRRGLLVLEPVDSAPADDPGRVVKLHQVTSAQIQRDTGSGGAARRFSMWTLAASTVGSSRGGSISGSAGGAVNSQSSGGIGGAGTAATFVLHMVSGQTMTFMAPSVAEVAEWFDAINAARVSGKASGQSSAVTVGAT